MAYNELIKSFGKIRDYVNQFYVYGYKTRQGYSQKSARSYDNERRRIESWLGDYIAFNQSADGKSIYLSVDSRAIAHNPLYNAFKAKSFTQNDILLHFYILDILSDKCAHCISDIADTISNDYLSAFEDAYAPDESTLRKKLIEYEKLGLINKIKRGKTIYYSISNDSICLDRWQDAIAFFSEADELGIVGSYILDKYSNTADYFSFKHHYILHALESEVLYSILLAIDEGKALSIDLYEVRGKELSSIEVVPVKIYVSTQGGRRYLCAYNIRQRRFVFFRLDSIKAVSVLENTVEYQKYLDIYERHRHKLWGVSTGKKRSLEHIEMTVFFNDSEEHIFNRLMREKRCGMVERLDNNRCRFTADVYDAMEMLPWLRSFIGRIELLECSNHNVTDTFYADIREMKRMYGGDSSDI